ncbi:class I SAM-dependent methyltransferase [Streptomyces triticagri]|uniref:Class I SAM-dependent methyltransferase n=1 Tax=Streptomyces triticagri TaxID=2293568 RepID=A0A372M2L7_9ACTN|nr:class I SAM-dependent methyltransferase [Streptomyces triticagri]RFU84713.1 class I SAM-dependent methyltransferase [Streptomyces triticagri]
MTSATTPAGTGAETTSAPAGPGPLLALNFGFARARVLGTALELGVFDALAVEPRPSVELARELGCDADALARLLDATAELGLTRGDDLAGRRLTPVAAEYLVRARPDHLGDHFADVLHDQWDRWAALTRTVRTGDRGGGAGAPGERGRTPGLFAAQYPLAAPVAAEVVAALGVRAWGVAPHRVLDYAAGGGEWGIALARVDASVEVTAHDVPEVLELTREHVRQAGVGARFSFVPGSFAPGSVVPDRWDTVVLAGVGRFAGARETGRLLAECAGLLRPGGTLLLADVMRPAPGTPAGARPMLDLSLLVNTRHGELADPADLRTEMAKHGITPKETVTRGLITALTGERR